MLVNAAGVIEPYAIEDDNSEALAERDLATNVLDSDVTCGAAVPAESVAGRHHLLLVDSPALAPAPGVAVYSATNLAVHSLARSLCRELGGVIKVFDLIPELTDTGPMR